MTGFGAGVMGEASVWEPDERREAAEFGLVQPDPDPVPGGQPGDHQQADPLGDIDIRRRRIVQLLVRVRHLLGRHADTPVGDLDQGAAGGQNLAPDMDRHIARRERRRVVDQLDEQVYRVVDGRPAHRNVRLDLEGDPLVVLYSDSAASTRWASVIGWFQLVAGS